MSETKKKTLTITSGGFDPLHDGHLDYLKLASALGDDTVCIVNSDEWLDRKKGYHFYNRGQRMYLLNGLSCTGHVLAAVDHDDTVCKTLELIAAVYRDWNLVFCKGGDRTANEIPEAETCRRLGIKIQDGLGPKVESSSEAVRRAKEAERPSPAEFHHQEDTGVN